MADEPHWPPNTALDEELAVKVSASEDPMAVDGLKLGERASPGEEPDAKKQKQVGKFSLSKLD